MIELRRRKRWPGSVAHMRNLRSAQKASVGKLDERSSL
jgi:hypothetical protein